MRTVITVDSTGETDPTYNSETFMVKVERHRVVVPGMKNVRQLQLAPGQLPNWATPDAVVERGRMLRDALLQHAGIAGVLQNLSLAPVGDFCPIYVKFDEGDAELFTWEALCDAKDAFIALDRRWPIGRITDPANGSRTMRLFQAPVRLLAVISALGVATQATEWRHLRDAVTDARAAGLDVRMRVLVGESALHTTIAAEIANGLAGVELGSVSGTSAQLLADMIRWKPHIVHCFCHGRSDAATQKLDLATASDFTDRAAAKALGHPEDGPEHGSISFTVEQIVNMGLKLANPWLLTLNCCEGGQPGEDLTSIAHQAVSAAFPACIAMLEPVEATDAHEFTRALYPALFVELDLVAKALVASNRVEFEWAMVMHDARDAINQLHGADSANEREWVLPALYVRGVDAMLFERPQGGESEKDVVRFKLAARIASEWARTSGAGMTDAEREVVIADMLVDIPQRYWPNARGELGD